MAKYTDSKWDGGKGRFSIEELLRAIPAAMRRYAHAEAKSKNREVTKGDCHLPYKEPDGTINIHGIESALGRLNQVEGPSSAEKSQARAELESARRSARKSLGMPPVADEKMSALIKLGENLLASYIGARTVQPESKPDKPAESLTDKKLDLSKKKSSGLNLGRLVQLLDVYGAPGTAPKADPADVVRYDPAWDGSDPVTGGGMWDGYDMWDGYGRPVRRNTGVIDHLDDGESDYSQLPPPYKEADKNDNDNDGCDRYGACAVDPDHDGDDDSTPAGDVDKDYWPTGGKPVKAPIYGAGGEKGATPDGRDPVKAEDGKYADGTYSYDRVNSYKYPNYGSDYPETPPTDNNRPDQWGGIEGGGSKIIGFSSNDMRPLPDFRKLGITRKAGQALPEELAAFRGATKKDGSPMQPEDYFSVGALLANNDLIEDRMRVIPALELARLGAILQTRSKQSDTDHTRRVLSGHFTVVNPGIGVDGSWPLHPENPMRNMEPYTGLTARAVFPLAEDDPGQMAAVEAARKGRLRNVSITPWFDGVACSVCGHMPVTAVDHDGMTVKAFQVHPDHAARLSDLNDGLPGVLRTPYPRMPGGFHFGDATITGVDHNDGTVKIMPVGVSKLKLGPGSLLLTKMRPMPMTMFAAGTSEGPHYCSLHGMEGSLFDDKRIVGIFTNVKGLINVAATDAGAVADAKLVLDPDARY